MTGTQAAVPTTDRAVPRAVVAVGGARLGYAALTRRPPGGEKTWTRTNHRGEPVTLLEGPAVTVAAAAAAATVPGLAGCDRLALALAGTCAGALGCYDDLAGAGDRRGFRGHLGALAGGEVTTGAVKIVGIGAAGLAAALIAGRPGAGSPGASARGGSRGSSPGASARGGSRGSSPGASTAAGRVADMVINAGLVAGGANLINLFDLRPGRAIKVTLLAGAALAAGGARSRAAAAAPVGAAIALLPEDLGERAMLGDAGANALGAMLGVAATALPRAVRVTVLAGIAGLTVASEKVSFTKVIERSPALRRLDMLGRRPAPVAGRPGGGSPAERVSEPASGKPGAIEPKAEPEARASERAGKP